MNKRTLFAALAAAILLSNFASADSVEMNGISWTYSNKDDTNLTLTLGSGVSSETAMPKETTLDAGNIPSSLVIGEKSYRVTAIADYAFMGCKNLTGRLVIPESVTEVGQQAFDNADGLTGIDSFGGNVSLGIACFANCDYLTTVSDDFSNVKNMKEQLFINCTKLNGLLALGTTKVYLDRLNKNNDKIKVFFAGPGTTAGGRSGAGQACSAAGVRAFLPEKKEWKTNTTPPKDISFGNSNYVLYYGTGLPLDLTLDMDKKVLSATTATAHAFTNVLVAASTFKSEWGIDTRIDLTNAIDVAEGTLTNDMLAGATFDSLIFNVKTQAQLDMVMNATEGLSVPLCIDPTGAKKKMIIPANRKVWVLLSGEGTYSPHVDGFSIAIR